MNLRHKSEFEENKMISSVINSLESSANQKNYWKSLHEIATMVGYSVDETKKIIFEDISDFVRNKHGKYTTRKLYRKFTPFTRKIFDAYIGKIQ